MRFSQHFKAVGTLVHGIYTIDKIYEDDKLDWDDTPAIMSFIGGQILIWGGDFLDWRKIHKKPLYVIEAAVLAGGIASYAIGGREGLVAYTDILTGKVTPKDWYEVVAPPVTEKLKELDEKTDEWSVAIAGWVDDRLMDIQHSLEREYQEKKTLLEGGWELLNRYGRWANPTPGAPWL